VRHSLAFKANQISLTDDIVGESMVQTELILRSVPVARGMRNVAKAFILATK